MKKFSDKYRIPSARAQWWDYGENGTYFITICTAQREFFFGEISDSVMVLSNLGKIVEKYWLEIPVHFSNVKLDEFVIMPNHFHGIITIQKMTIENELVDKTMISDITISGNYDGKKTILGLHDVETPKLGVSTRPSPEMLPSPEPISRTEPELSPGKYGGKNDKWHRGVLGVVINQFKRKCTMECRKLDAYFAWQSRFYDHIICSQESYFTIKEYIKSNNKKWESDKFYPGTDRK